MSDNNAPPSAPGTPSGKRHIDGAIGHRLRIRREMMNLDLEQLAARVGCDPRLLAAYENGAKRCPAAQLDTLVRTLDVTIAWLFADLVSSPPSDLELAEPESHVVEFAQARPDLSEHQVLLDLFSRIRDPGLRRTVLDLARSLAEHEKKAAEG
jgi:transcriptional regulator with XRE-family HTH domain